MARRLASLTPQQIRVLMMLSRGLLNKQIAYELGVSEATVKAHVSAIFQKLGVESRTQAVILATKIEAAQELLDRVLTARFKRCVAFLQTALWPNPCTVRTGWIVARTFVSEKGVRGVDLAPFIASADLFEPSAYRLASGEGTWGC